MFSSFRSLQTQNQINNVVRESEVVKREDKPVNDAATVKVGQCRQDLGRVESSTRLLEIPILAQVPEELTSVDVFHNQVESVLRLEGRVKTNEERVAQTLHDPSLGLQVSHVLLAHELGLFQHLDGEDLGCFLLGTEQDLAKVTPANHLQEFKIVQRLGLLLVRGIRDGHDLGWFSRLLHFQTRSNLQLVDPLGCGVAKQTKQKQKSKQTRQFSEQDQKEREKPI